jgi:peptidyl-tRNA hydrolase, PTH1 family
MAEWRVILGIGNPGREYEGTRHNLGFDVVDELARRWGGQFSKHAKWQTDLCELPLLPSLGARRILLLKPRTYVNCSGRVVQAVLSFYKLLPEQLLVVVDDLHLRLGDIRLRGNGSAGGHNGLRDIEAQIGRAYPRMRLGIKNPERQDQDQVGFVLGRFAPDEQDDAVLLRQKSTDCCQCWLNEGLDAAMRFNGPLRPPPAKPKKPAPAPPEDAEQSKPDPETGGSDH